MRFGMGSSLIGWIVHRPSSYWPLKDRPLHGRTAGLPAGCPWQSGMPCRSSYQLLVQDTVLEGPDVVEEVALPKGLEQELELPVWLSCFPKEGVDTLGFV